MVTRVELEAELRDVLEGHGIVSDVMDRKLKTFVGEFFSDPNNGMDDEDDDSDDDMDEEDEDELDDEDDDDY